MKPTVRQRIAEEIDLPAPTAFWVLGAHLFVLLSSLPLLLILPRHPLAFANPALIYAGVAVYTAAIAFECSQNTLDHWYLTNTRETFCDCLFNSFMIAGFGLMAMGASSAPWVWALAIVVAVAHPLFYVAGSWVRFPLLTLSLLLVDYATFSVLAAPIVFVHTLATFAGLYFLALLMRTQAQAFHGCAAVCFGLSLYAFPVAIDNHVQGDTIPWTMIGIGSAGGVLLLGLLWPALSKASATQRRQGAHATTRDAQMLA